MSRRRIIITIIALALALAGLMTAPGARAVTPRSALAAPAVEIGTNQDGSSQCMNRQGGGHVQNFTYVIGWSCGDNNNDFEFQNVWYQPCQSQTVTATCPFTNTAFDQMWDGAPIVEIDEYDYGYCIGTANGNSFTDKLEGCADSNGLNGGWNGIMVALGQPGNTPNCVINVHATNTFGGTAHIYAQLSNGHGNPVTVSTGPITGGCSSAAQWKELFG